jgi:protein-L-isoaspartate O-methyltransferase
MRGTNASPRCRSSIVIPNRVRWAVEILDPQPADRILEAGGGPGVSAGLLCSRLKTGLLVEIDRSAVAIARCATRNTAFIADGHLRLVQSALSDVVWPEPQFDAFLSVDVNPFWTSGAAPELAVIRRVLRPGGKVLILYGAAAPGADTTRMQEIAQRLSNAGFSNATVISGDGGIGVAAFAPGE